MFYLASLPLLLAAALSAGAALAGDLYRWQDEQGRLHLSDTPPPPGARPVTRQEMPRNDVTPEQQRSAAERAARDRARLQQGEAERNAPAVAPTTPRPAAPGASAPQLTRAQECARLREEYFRSHECFGKFRNATGGIRAEAYTVCGPEVKDPVQGCNPPSNPPNYQ